MTEHTLHILIKLFAYIINVSGERASILAKSFVEAFLSHQFSANTVSKQIELFETELAACEKYDDISEDYRRAVKHNIYTWCSELNKDLSINQKFLVLVNLLGFVKLKNENSRALFLDECIAEVAGIFKIDSREFNNCRSFIEDRILETQGGKNILVITGSKITGSLGIRYSLKEGMTGYIRVLKIDSIHSYLFMVSGDDHLEINNRHIYKRHVYFFNRGSSIQGSKISPVYYSDVERFFIEIVPDNEIELTVKNLEYKFMDRTIGIHKLSLTACSGQMVAIMGGSGTGKSTLLNLLNGNLKPSNGSIFINGLDIYQNKENVRGLIGYVPQDDVLLEELTVYQNLYYSTKLCFGDSDIKMLDEKITHTLNSLDLCEIKNMKVGTSLNKFISGGQRKRLNIALELIREPFVIFVDEPTSGLSSSDSEKMIDLLKEQTQKGKLVFITVHQPSSEIFKTFDKLLIFDKGGYPVYWGNPLESQRYLKNCLYLLDAEQNECLSCGNVNPEDILLLIESKKINESGSETEIRKNTPEDWYGFFLEKIQKKILSPEINNRVIPQIIFKLPTEPKQFVIFSVRNFVSKLTDKQYIIISLAEAPLLALILGYFMRQTDIITHTYDFSKNENIPSYLFMSIIVALFIGLMASSEEIIRDRKILRREEFIGLNRCAYINSKVVYLFGLSFIQMLLFVVIGNHILEIKGMTVNYFLVLWSIACFANMLGLNVSNSFKSVIAIYIMVPFLLIPQILLAGVVVNYRNLHHTLASQEYVPVLGDIMVSRWGYEALAVEQFKNNKYHKSTGYLDQPISDAVYQVNYKLPELVEITSNSLPLNQENKVCSEQNRITKTALLENNLNLLKSELNKYNHFFNDIGFDFYDSLQPTFITDNILYKTDNTLRKLVTLYSKQWNEYEKQKDEASKISIHSNGKEYCIKLKQDYFNEKLNDVVLDNSGFAKYTISGDKIIRIYQPVYHLPENRFGRAHFYAPVKRISDFYIDTFWFNVAVIWVMTFLLYFILLNNTIFKMNKVLLYMKTHCACILKAG